MKLMNKTQQTDLVSHVACLYMAEKLRIKQVKKINDRVYGSSGRVKT